MKILGIINDDFKTWSDKYGKYLHWCPDWDYMLIDPLDPEFMACTCKFSDMEEKKKLQLELAQKYPQPSE